MLKLEPADDTHRENTIRCSLQHFDLDNPGTETYDALSYVWGDPKRVRPIYCNDFLVNVTVSLHGALTRLRETNCCTLWADAVCIDQANVAERNHQVAMMGRVYECASNVHIWLGQDLHDDAQHAFELCHDINAYYSDGYHSDEESRWYDWPSPPGPDEPFLQASRWKHLQELSQSPWFTRLWVVQEAGVAQTAEVHWGDVSIKFSELIEAFTFINIHACFIPLVAKYGFDFTNITDSWWQIWCTYDNKTSWKNERPYTRYTAIHPEIAQRRGIFNVLYVGTKFKASNPHDYIYGHLGHPAARSPDGSNFVKVDYSRSVSDLYLDVAKKLLDGEKHGLLLLSAVEHTGDELGMPSWVPQWHKASDLGMIAPVPSFKRWYDASLSDLVASNGYITAEVIEGTRLRTRGIIFDNVSAYSDMFEEVQGTVSQHPVEAALSLAHASLDVTAIEIETLDAISLVMIAGMDAHSGNAAEEDLQKHRASFLEYCQTEDRLSSESLKTIEETFPAALLEWTSGDGKQYRRNLEDYCHHRRLFRTSDERFGLGPSTMRHGDLCCVIFGGCVPFIIRRCGPEFLLIGECYIHDIMRGEIVSQKLRQGYAMDDIVLK